MMILILTMRRKVEWQVKEKVLYIYTGLVIVKKYVRNLFIDEGKD